MKLNKISKPQAKPTVNSLTPAIGDMVPLTELTQSDYQNRCCLQALMRQLRVAPVSLTLRVKTMIAPERIEYFVIGHTIVLKTAKGLAPKVLAASSMSTVIRSIAADIDRQSRGK